MREIRSARVPAPAGTYSQAIEHGGFVFLAGQGPFSASGERVGVTFAEQARLTFENLKLVAQAAGADLGGTVRLGVYLSSLDHFEEFNVIARDYLTEPYPARTTLQVALRGFDIELDAVVAMPVHAGETR